MPIWKRLGFLLVFVVPALMPMAAWLGVRSGHPALMAWFPLFFLFLVLPVVDVLLGHDPGQPRADAEAALEHDAWFRAITLVALPVQVALLAWSAWFLLHAGLGVVGAVGWMLSQGVVGGVIAINVAHELIHKDTRLEPMVGGLLLASVGYHGFKVEHVRGHHVNVSTPRDASSARAGQTLWNFLPRALLLNNINAWRLEARRLRGRGLHWCHWRNELIGWTAVWLGAAGAFWLWLGPLGFVFFVAQGLLAACALETINYIEHYGLERARLADGRYERTTHMHSWNSDYALSNLILLHLQRHSDHHESPRRRYPLLQHHAASPQLPGGYAAMLVLALFPPLWFRVVDPVLAYWKDASAGRPQPLTH